MFGSYRILEREFNNGDVKYILEQERDGQWVSVFRSPSLDIIKEAKLERESGSGPGVKREKVIE